MFYLYIIIDRFSSLIAQLVKNQPAVWETWVRFLGWEDPLEKGTATHSRILAWRIPWTEEPGRLHSPWGHKGSDTTERFSFHFTSLSSFIVLWIKLVFRLSVVYSCIPLVSPTHAYQHPQHLLLPPVYVLPNAHTLKDCHNYYYLYCYQLTSNFKANHLKMLIRYHYP